MKSMLFVRGDESGGRVLSHDLSKCISPSHLLELIFRSLTYAVLPGPADLGNKSDSAALGSLPQGCEFWDSVWVEGGRKETGI